MALKPGEIAIFDKGYVNYQLYPKWDEEGIYFVTREKDNAKYKIVERKKSLKWI